MSIHLFFHNSKEHVSQIKRNSLQMEVLEDRTLLSASPSALIDESMSFPIDASPQTIVMLLDNSESLTVDMGDSTNRGLQTCDSQLSPSDDLTTAADPTTLSLDANENYNSNDYNKLRSFLEQTDSNGVKNGLKVNAQYNSNNPETWTGVVWNVIEGQKRVTSVNWTSLCLAGNADFSNCTYLTELDITGKDSEHYGSLASLNISGCTQLSQLNLYYNQLKNLDLTSNIALNGLDCTGNQLSSIDVTQNTALTYLRVYENQLYSLDVSQNTELTHLITCYNHLTSLDVSHNPKIQLLQCYNNRIVTLDLRNNVNLNELICWNPTLTTVQMSEAAIDKVRIRLCVADNTPWTYKNSAGQVLTTTTSANPYFTISELPVYATNQDNSQTISFELGAEADFDASECEQLSAFLEQNGNGLKVNPGYIADNPNTWGVQWVEFDGVKHAYVIDWTAKCLSGSADLSNFTYLKNLAITGESQENPGGLTSLNISGCTALEGCDCYYNQLTELDLSTNSALRGVTCNDNQLTSLDVSHNDLLQWLDCQTNQISSLNVSSNSALTHLHCSGNPIQSLNLAQNTKLTELYCNSNSLTTLDLSKNTALTTLRCWNENLATVTLPESAAGQLSVNLYRGSWTGWAYTCNGETTNLTTNEYVPASIPFTATNQDNSQTISFELGAEADFDASECEQLSAFLEQNGNGLKVNPEYIADNPNTWGVQWVEFDGVKHAYVIDWTAKCLSGSADLSNFTYLKNLAITGESQENPGGLTSLNISGCTALEGCDCYYNQLTELDLSTNSALRGVTCNDNQLTSLDVSHNDLLQWLDCQTNQISSLNVSSNSALTHLHCSGNQLQSLNLSQNAKLTELYCNSNSLTTLDLSKNTALTTLRCWNENLTTVTLPESAAGQLSVNLYWGSWTGWSYTCNGNTTDSTTNAYVPAAVPFTASNETQTITFKLTSQTSNVELNARVVFRNSLTNVDASADLPEGISSIRAGKTVYAEIWLKDVDASDPGIVGGYLNMLYDNAALTVQNVTYGTVFVNQTGIQQYEDGKVSSIGGVTDLEVFDKGDDEWVRLATVSFVANEAGSTTVSLGAPNASYYNMTRSDAITLSNEQIDFGSAVLEVTVACPMDIDGDGYIAVSDYALLSRAWLSNPTSPNWNPACDIDGDGFVAVSDYTYLSRNWLKSVDAPDLYYPGAIASPAAMDSEDVVGNLDEQPLLIAAESAVVDLSASMFSEEISFDLNHPVALEANEIVNVRLTAVTNKSASDTADAVPASLTDINPGDSFFVEIWVRNMNGYEDMNLCGLTGGYLNISYPSDLLNVGEITYGSVFSQLNNLQTTSTAGVIDLIGGVTQTSVTGMGDDEWVRLATVSFTAADTGDATIESLPQTLMPAANLTLTSGQTLKNDEIDFGSVSLSIGSIVIQLTVQNDFVKTTLNNPVVIDYRENDDVSDWSETTVQFGNASYGEYAVNEDGTISYTPEDGFYGTDAVSYAVVDKSGKLSTGSIVISIGLPIATSVQNTSDSHSPSTSMAASVPSLTDWDDCYVELWAQGVNELNPGETTLTMEYNPAVYNAPTFSACADGVALTVSQSSVLPNGNIQVELTAQVLEPLASQTDNLFLGTVVLTPSMDANAGVPDVLTPVSICAVDGSEQTTTVEAMPYDLIRTGFVDVNDFIAFATVFGYKLNSMSEDNPLYAQTVMSDFNNDGIVNVDDFILFAMNYGASKKTSVKPTAQPAAPVDVINNEDVVNNEESGVKSFESVLNDNAEAVPESVVPILVSESNVESSMTLLEAYSTALLDLYDNNERADLSDVSNVLAESRMDALTKRYSDDVSPKTSSDAIDAVLEDNLLAIDWDN